MSLKAGGKLGFLWRPRFTVLHALLTCILLYFLTVGSKRWICYCPPVVQCPPAVEEVLETTATALDAAFDVRIPSLDGKSDEPFTLPPSVSSVVTYVNGANGIPAIMAYRKRCADADWNSNHKEALFKQSYSEILDIDVAIDIGACYGDTAVPIAVNSKQVIAFEPNPYSFDVLQVNARLNPHLNISTHNFAVGTNDEEVLKFTYGGDMCNGGVEGNWKDSSTETALEVKTINLEKFLKREYGNHIFERIGFIKIDTEGFDASILRSMKVMMPRLKEGLLIQVEWFDYFDTSRHGGSAGPNDVSGGSRELFTAIEDLGMIPYYDSKLTQRAPGPQNKHHASDLYFGKKNNEV